MSGGEGVAELPTGTVTFLFTDLEHSTRLWEEHPEAMKPALARHDEILRDAVASHAGHVVKMRGDGVHAAFSTAHDALEAAAEAQQTLAGQDWVATGPLRVRMGVHTGEAESRDGDYFGSAPNRAARLMAIAHGGQVLVSSVTAELVGAALGDGARLADLGEHRLRDLSRPERVYQLAVPGLDDAFPPLRSVDVLPTNLPVQLTSFVGRNEEVQAIEELATSHRVVTLTGVGGVGKTRLALQVAAESLDRFRDGVWLVELAGVDAPRVVAVIAGVLGIGVRSGQAVESSLLDSLRSRELLLVLDNCEHLIREVRRIVELIVRGSEAVEFLLTSREGLRVPGEQLYSVPSLDDDAAVRLFVERAGAVDATFRLSDDHVATVAGLCAAARVSMFSIDDLAKRVDQRFRLLTGGRGGVERHQTLRAAIDWSYDLLTPQEQLVLARLSVFAGGCTLDAAEAVVADEEPSVDEVLDLIAGLVDKSLVVVDRTRSVTRYEMLETVRQYAYERLVASGDSEAVQRRHAAWYAGFARAAGRGLYSADEQVWLERLRGEIDNLEVAVGWAVGAEETEIAMRIGGSFPRQGAARPLLGTAYLAEQAMRVAGAQEHPLRGRVLAEAAWAAVIRGDMVEVRTMLEASIDAQRAGARYAAAAFTYLLQRAGWTDGSWGDAYAIATEGLAMAEAADDVMGANGLRIALSAQAMLLGRDAEALELAERALADARRLQQPTLEAAALYVNGLALATADPERAIALLHETLELTRRLEIDSERIAALGLLATLEAQHGNARRSLEAIREQLVTSAPSAAFRVSNFYITLAVFNRVGRADLGARCHGHVEQLGVVSPGFFNKFHDDAVRDARAALGDETFERYAADGAAAPTEEFLEMMVREIDDLLGHMPME